MIARAALAVALLGAVACGEPDGGEVPAPGAPGEAPTRVEEPAAEAPAVDTAAASDTAGTAADTAAAAPGSASAPAPPGGYALESRPAGAGRLARIVYASPRITPEVARFYDETIRASRRIEIDIAGDNVVAYALSPATALGPGTTEEEIAALLERRAEPIVVVEPWTPRPDDPLVMDLHDAGQHERAEELLDSRSRVTIVYAVRP